MDETKIIIWLPRILGIGLVLFLSLFAADVFGEYSGWQLAIALFMHLIPSLVLLAAVAIAWKRELFGAIAFLFGAIFYVCVIGFDGHWTWYAFISGPAVVVSALYFAAWRQKRKLKN
jgi:hypothetical protein